MAKQKGKGEAPAPKVNKQQYRTEANRARRLAKDKRMREEHQRKRLKVARGTARKNRRYDLDAWRNEKAKQAGLLGTVIINGRPYGGHREAAAERS